MKYFNIHHYNVPKGFSITESDLETLDREFMPTYAARPIGVMVMADFCQNHARYKREPEMEAKRVRFLRWYMARYSEDTQWGKKYTTISPVFFPTLGKRYLTLDEQGNTEVVESLKEIQYS